MSLPMRYGAHEITECGRCGHQVYDAYLDPSQVSSPRMVCATCLMRVCVKAMPLTGSLVAHRIVRQTDHNRQRVSPHARASAPKGRTVRRSRFGTGSEFLD